MLPEIPNPAMRMLVLPPQPELQPAELALILRRQGLLLLTSRRRALRPHPESSPAAYRLLAVQRGRQPRAAQRSQRLLLLRSH